MSFNKIWGVQQSGINVTYWQLLPMPITDSCLCYRAKKSNAWQDSFRTSVKGHA